MKNLRIMRLNSYLMIVHIENYHINCYNHNFDSNLVLSLNAENVSICFKSFGKLFHIFAPLYKMLFLN